jgi:hypothetical protein
MCSDVQHPKRRAQNAEAKGHFFAAHDGHIEISHQEIERGAAVEFLGSDGTAVEVAEQVAPAADWAYASIRRKLVVNSIATEASTLFSP